MGIVRGVIPVLEGPIQEDAAAHRVRDIVIGTGIPRRHLARIEIWIGDGMIRILRFVHEGSVELVAPVSGLGDPVGPKLDSGVAGFEVRDGRLHEGPNRVHEDPPTRNILQGQEINVIHLAGREGVSHRVHDPCEVRHGHIGAVPLGLVDPHGDIADIPVVQTREGFDRDPSRPNPFSIALKVPRKRVIGRDRDSAFFCDGENGVVGNPIVQCVQAVRSLVLRSVDIGLQLGEQGSRLGESENLLLLGGIPPVDPREMLDHRKGEDREDHDREGKLHKGEAPLRERSTQRTRMSTIFVPMIHHDLYPPQFLRLPLSMVFRMALLIRYWPTSTMSAFRTPSSYSSSE